MTAPARFAYTECAPFGCDLHWQHSYERLWFSITEALLAMTMFREEFNTEFLFLFAILLVAKLFHWLASDRIDFVRAGAGANALPREAKRPSLQRGRPRAACGRVAIRWSRARRFRGSSTRA